MRLRQLTISGHTTSTAHRLVHYDGACNNFHGHNMEWNATLTVRVPDENHQMAEDFKDISDVFDRYDHATLLNMADPLYKEVDILFKEGTESVYVDHPLLGDTYAFDGDPTCEKITRVVADELVMEFDNVVDAEVELKETQKYGMSASYPDGYA